LNILSRKTKGCLALMAVVTAVAAVASPASASEIPAKFSASTIKLTTTGMTVKRNGEDPRTCTPEGGSFSGGTSEGIASVGGFYPVSFKCSGPSTLQMNFFAKVVWDTVASKYIFQTGGGAGASLISPWGSYSPAASVKSTWVNGSGSTNSTLKFENTILGNGTGGNVTLTGTFTATTSSGGLLTLSH